MGVLQSTAPEVVGTRMSPSVFAFSTNRFVVWWSRYETFYTLAYRNTYYPWANDPYRYKTPWIRGIQYACDTDLPRRGPSWTRLLKVRVSQLLGVFATKGWTSSSLDAFSVEDDGDESSWRQVDDVYDDNKGVISRRHRCRSISNTSDGRTHGGFLFRV